MDNIERNIIIDEIRKLSKPQQKAIIHELQLKSFDSINLSALRKNRLEINELSCPHCKSKNIIGWGKNKHHVNRYRCSDCLKTFNDFTGTSFSNIHFKEIIGEYVLCLSQYMSIRKTAKKIGISIPTAFSYRHRILSALYNDNKLNGIVESDVTYFKHSEKGNKKLERIARRRGSDLDVNTDISVLISSDRDNHLVLTKSCIGEINNQNIEVSLSNKVNKKNIICSSIQTPYIKYTTDKNIKHVIYNPEEKQEIKDKAFHLKYVKMSEIEIKQIINETYRGVATKYLHNYLSLYGIKKYHKNSKNISEEILNNALTNTKDEYKKIKERYNEFITK